MKLTTAQTQGLKYYAAKQIQDKAEKVAALRRIPHPDPRVISSLRDMGLIQPVGECYGTVFGLSAAGMALAQ